MPVRIRITLLYTFLVLIILGMVCSGIYFFSQQSRENTIKRRLTNRALTTARLLSQQELFDKELIQRIDASTTLSLQRKSIEAYNTKFQRIYQYSDDPFDTLNISPQLLAQVAKKGQVFFIDDTKEVIGYHFKSNNANLLIFAGGEDNEGHERLASLFNILLLSFFAGNILVLISGYIFSRELLLPIKKISDDVAEISAQNLTRRINTGKTKDEWHQLSNTLNDLLDRLQESFEMQRRFIANASHELSTPLTAISSQLEISLSRDRDSEAYKEVMSSIYQDVQHLCKLTQTLLEFAKASGNAGGLEINLVRMDEVVLRMPAEASQANKDYIVRIDFGELPEQEEFLLVFGNETLLFTAIKNLVLNACKYSPDHTAHVMLHIDAANQVIISVQDKGPGIAAEELENIFQPFYRIEGNLPASGFGLGLSLASRIIKIHKGQIKVKSAAGAGTRFEIILPGASSLKKL